MKTKTKSSSVGVSLLLATTGVILLCTPSTLHAAEQANKNSGSDVVRMFGAIAPYDADKDNAIDEVESTSLAKAISDGTVKLPDAPKAPLGMKPPAGILVGRLSMAYASLAPYDKNKNAILDGGELRQLQSDVAAGKVTLPFPPVKK